MRVASHVRAAEEGDVGTPWKGRKMEGRRLMVEGAGVVGVAVCGVLGSDLRGERQSSYRRGCVCRLDRWWR